jgi:moderate conductance mechanosensitive channel
VNKIARRLVKLLVRRVGHRRARRGPGLVRRHTPAALLDTGELVNTRAAQRIEALAAALAGATSFVVWVVAALAVLHVLGVRIGVLLTGAGLIGVALGFGAQSLIRDDSFSLQVRDGERPTDVFNHPYAFAAYHGIETTSRAPDPEYALW